MTRPCRFLKSLGPVNIQPSVATLVHFQPLEAKFSSSTGSTKRKIPLPESENVLRVSRMAECPQTLNVHDWAHELGHRTNTDKAN